MPRFPSTAAGLEKVGGSVYSRLGERARQADEVFPLHIGDTWLEPPAGCHMEDLKTADHPYLSRYTAPQGLPELRQRVAERVEQRSGVTTTADQVLISTGATGGLGAAIGALIEPGDEVLILAPYWPLISGIVRSFHGRPIAVPVHARTPPSPGGRNHPNATDALGIADTLAALDSKLSARTVALYLNTPNNPTGRVLSRDYLRSLAEWARRHDLWLLADEVYEDYVYRGEHVACRSLAPERTVASYSFSKAYGMTGNRCGYVVAPSEVISELCKIGTHTFYSTPTASQVAAVAALGSAGDRWLAETREKYRQLATATANELGVAAPDGGTFLFLEVSNLLGPEGLPGLLAECAEHGLLLAPGNSFGPYPTHLRLCFTATAPEQTERGVQRLAALLARRG